MTASHKAATAGGRDGIEDSELTYNETIDAIVQFFEAAFHTILYVRGVYPPEIFKLHRLYSHPVYRSRHPGLNEYISTVLSSVRSELHASRVSQVLLVLKSASTGAFMERYVFRLSYLLEGAHAVSRADRDLAIRDNVTFRELSSIFRGFLMKLAVCEAGLEEVPDTEDLEFAVLVQAREGCRIGPQGEDTNQPDEGMWVPADPKEGFFSQRNAADEDEDEEMSGVGRSELRARRRIPGSHRAGQDEDEDTTILPIKSLDSGVINLMLYVEDNPTTKSSLRRSTRSRRSGVGQTSTPQRRSGADSQQRQKQQAEAVEQDLFMELSGSRERDIEDLLAQDISGRPPGRAHGGDDDVEGSGDAGQSRGTKRKGIVSQRRFSKGKEKARAKPKSKKKGKDAAAAAAGPSLTLTHEDQSSEELSDSSASLATYDSDEDGVEGEGKGSRSPSSHDKSDDDEGSIVSVGDFAGYGGTGAGMGAAW